MSKEKAEAAKPKTATVLEEKPKNNLPKYAVLYFGDTIGKLTLINYLAGRVVGNENAIKPKEQLIVFKVLTNSNENSNIQRGLDTLFKLFGSPAEITDIKTNFKDQSDAYIHGFNNPDFLDQLIGTMGDDIQFLVFTQDNSAFSGLASNFNVGLIETHFNNYNANNEGKAPKRLIYENSHKDLTIETEKYMEMIRELFNKRDDEPAKALIESNIEIDIEAMPKGHTKDIADHYFKARNQPDLPLSFKLLVDKGIKDKEKTFIIRQYKID